MNDKPRVLILIPAFNEEAIIGKTVTEIRNSIAKSDFASFDLVVIDDASSDRTANLAAEAGARVVTLPMNLGIGGAVQAGYMYAEKGDYDIAVHMDGDGQHDPAEIKNLVFPVLQGECDYNIGCRFHDTCKYQASLFRRMGMIFASFITLMATGVDIPDPTSGFSAVNRACIQIFCREWHLHFAAVPSYIEAHRKGLKIKIMPAHFRKRSTGYSSITLCEAVFSPFRIMITALGSVIRKSGV
ncbi:MAG: glycosyltransferase family 2 protein [Lentisphaerae bacterium]|nr:glycosyltransferase family 2 protein [Lentisphaerota bacterium]